MNHIEAEQEAGSRAKSPTTWRGAAAIQMARQMNERCVEFLCDLSFKSSSEANWLFLLSNRDLWQRLDSEGRRRLATFPFVIVDLRFGEEAWWLEIERSACNDGMKSSDIPMLPSECLALETLMFAWQVAREDSRVAHMVFGMGQAVAEHIASLSMRSVRTIAIQRAQFLRVRWEGKPRFWRELLIAAASDDEAAMAVLKLQAARRFLGAIGRIGVS